MRKIIKFFIPIKYHWFVYNKVRDVVGWRTRSYSAFGEDIVVSKLSNDKKNGFFVDVGAFHPFKYSNTYYLKKYYDWKGINIEPNPENFKLFLKHRKDDINLNVGVSLEKGVLDYFTFKDPLFNTFDESRKNQLEEEGIESTNSIPVDVVPLSILLTQYLENREIDFLNVDVEMYDLEVLKSIDWNGKKPKVIAVEDHGMNLELCEKSLIFQFLKGKGYKLESKCHFSSIYKLIEY